MWQGQTAMLNRPRNNRGVTLVEVLIALTILLIVFIGLIQAAFLTINQNMRNILRDEAVQITSEQVALLRGASFDDMNRDGATDAATLTALNFNNAWFPNTINRQFKAATVAFAINRNIITLNADNKQLTVTTTWTWQGDNYQHQVLTTRRR